MIRHVLTDAEMTRLLALNRLETAEGLLPDATFDYDGTVAAIAAATGLEIPAAHQRILFWGARGRLRIHHRREEDTSKWVIVIGADTWNELVERYRQNSD